MIKTKKPPQINARELTTSNVTNWLKDYGDYLLQFAMQRVDNIEDAEELVQETFISAIRGLEGFDNKSTIKTWLTAIMKNKIYDFYRKNRRATFESLDDEKFKERESIFNRFGIWKEFVKKWGDDPQEILEGKEFSKVISRCLSKLPPSQKKIFMLHIFDGLAGDQICKDLEISSSNYWVSMHRCRMLLRQCIEKNWVLIKLD